MKEAKLKLLRGLNSAADLLDRAYRNFDVLRSEFLLATVPPEQRHRFIVHNYDRNQLFRSEQHHARLFDWERECFDDYFPPPPARVLVGGAGSGRELRALIERGYAVSGFEPAPGLVAHGRRMLAGSGPFELEVGSYEDLVAGRLELSRHGRFDAVVLGWGSLSHVATAEARHALFRALGECCPDGPVLLSWIEAKPVGERRQQLRRMLARVGSVDPHPNDSFRPHMGFIHSLGEEELARFATLSRRRVARVGAGPHAVLVP